MANKTLIVTVLAIYLAQLGVATTTNETDKKTFMVNGSVNGRWNNTHLALQEMTTTAANVTSNVNGVMIASVATMWITILVAIVVFCLFGSTKDRKVMLWWEYIVFTHLYFNIASFLVLYLPQGLHSAQGLAWIANGVLAAFTSVVISIGLAAIYSKVVKVFYGDFPDDTLWSVLRFGFIGFILTSGFGAGGLTMYIALNITAKTGERWLFAVGIIIAALTLVILPILCIAACLFDKDSERYRKGKKRKDKNKYKDKDIDRDRGSEGSTRAHRAHHASQVSKASGHIRAILEAGEKIDQQPLTLTQSPSRQSTGSTYYERLTAKMPKGESISMYGQPPASSPTSPATSPAPPPPLPPPTPSSSPAEPTTPPTSSPPVKKTPSQQSTGSHYYQMLLQGKVPKVKSISQYGPLLNQSPK